MALAAVAALFLSTPVDPARAQGTTLASPVTVRRTGAFGHPRLTESSGVAASRRQPGVLWTLNDSGNPPWLFAVDTAGRTLGVFGLTDASNIDWEAVTLGPCGGRDCVYVADIGDNRERRTSVRFYRIPEPPVSSGDGGREPRPVQPEARVDARYPDRAHDAEAVYAVGGDLYVVTKGRTLGLLLFRLPAAAWAVDSVVTLEAVGRLPIEADRDIRRLVTDAAISPDGHRVAVRTYRDVYVLARRPDGGLAFDGPPRICDIRGLEPQGEGIAWLDERRLVLTSERRGRRPGAIHLLECP